METGIGARRPNDSAEKQARFKQQLRVASTALKEPPRTPRRLESGRAPLSFAQQLLWFFSQLEPNSPPYNLPTALRLCDRLDRDALERALTAVVARHDALRGRFVAEDGNPVQVIGAPVPVEFPVLDLSQRGGAYGARPKCGALSGSKWRVRSTGRAICRCGRRRCDSAWPTMRWR